MIGTAERCKCRSDTLQGGKTFDRSNYAPRVYQLHYPGFGGSGHRLPVTMHRRAGVVLSAVNELDAIILVAGCDNL